MTRNSTAQRTNGVIWITGLPCAGKSTIARHLMTALRSERPAVLLDGDDLRALLPWPAGHTVGERRALAWYYARLARHLADQGHLVVCATVSLFHDVHAWNREHVRRYLEVLIEAPSRTRLERDSTGIYQSPADVLDRDIPVELPITPHLTLGNGPDTDPGALASRVLCAYADLDSPETTT